jgi:hypothetical protein
MSHKAYPYTVHLLLPSFLAAKSITFLTEEYYAFEKRPTFSSLKKFFPSYFLRLFLFCYIPLALKIIRNEATFPPGMQVRKPWCLLSSNWVRLGTPPPGGGAAIFEKDS